MVMVEDSIVRGTTLGVLARTVKKAGACEVHARIASPQYRYPCYFGIDTPKRDKLIAANMNDDEIAEYISADSIKYLSIEGLIKAIGIPKSCFCCACFDGKYPVEIDEAEKVKFAPKDEPEQNNKAPQSVLF